MKEILIPLNFTSTPTVYDTKQSFSTSDEASGVLTFTTTADVAGAVASLIIRNASENANRQTVLIERLDVNSSPFSYALKNQLPFGQYEGTVLLKKNLTVLASATFLFGVNSSLSSEVLPDLVKAYSLDELVENVETEVSNLKDAFTLTVSETVKGVNKTEKTLQAQENVRYLNEHTRKTNEESRIANEQARSAAEVLRKDTFDTLVDSAVIEETVAQEVVNEFQQIESTYANRLLSTEQQLEQTELTLEGIDRTFADTTYATLSALQTAYPTGDTKRYIVAADGKWYWWNGTAWTAGQVAQALGIANRSIVDTKIALDTKLVFKKPAKNLLNTASFTDNFYVNYLNGVLVANTGLVVFEDVYLEPNTDYVLSRNATGPLEQFALLNLDKQWVSGMLPASGLVEYTFNTGANISYLRLSGRKTKYPNQQLQLEKGTVRTEYYVYEAPTVKVAEIEKNAITTDYFSPEVITLIGASAENSVLVDALGGGDFTTIRAAVDSITDASSTKQYTIYINEGTYDLFSDYAPEEILATSFLGVVKKNYVSFVGTGRKEQTILRGALADDALSTTISRVAPIVAYGEGTFENLTIIGKNTRYAVHDDYNYPNTKRRVINCDIIKEPGLGLTPAYGAGCYSGMEYEFEDTKFHSQSTGYPFSFHNNVNFAKGAKFKIKNCEFLSQNGEWAIRFGSMGSGQTDTVEMTNCKIGGKILLNEENAGSGVGIDFKLTGYGNTKVPVDIINSSAEQATYEFIGETERVWNQSFGTILKGKPVKLTSKGCPVLPLATTDSPLLYAGIACEDIESFTFGVIRKSGYLPVADTGLTVAIGDKIGIVSGALAVVTTGDYIGYVELANYITLK